MRIRSPPTHLPAMAQQMIGQHAGHHGFAHRHAADADQFLTGNRSVRIPAEVSHVDPAPHIFHIDHAPGAVRRTFLEIDATHPRFQPSDNRRSGCRARPYVQMAVGRQRDNAIGNFHRVAGGMMFVRIGRRCQE